MHGKAIEPLNFSIGRKERKNKIGELFMLKYFAATLFISLLLVVSLAQSMSKESAKTNCDDCKYWWSKADLSIQLPKDTPEKDEKDEKNIIEAIDCLLKLKGNTNQTQYSAITNLKYLEAKIPSPTIEVVALYRISALYYQKWRHANAIVLVDKDRRQNTKEAVDAAYKSYEAWFEKVKKIGLEEARKQKLDPLADSDVSWY
jgi:hypothetical protein